MNASLPSMIVLTLLLAPALPCRAAEVEFLANKFCGPQCVQRVLEHYGLEVDLLDLIQETQWPNANAGSSFEGLSRSLERRGLHARAVRLGSLEELAWTGPAIVQCQVEGFMHFVVWLPPQGPDRPPRLWDGSQSDAFQARLLERSLTGPVLLVSDREIPDSAIAAVFLPDNSSLLRRVFLVGGLAIVMGFLARWIAQYVRGRWSLGFRS